MTDKKWYSHRKREMTNSCEKYIVQLTQEERESLLSCTSKGEVGARTMKRAQILLKADEGWKDADIMSALNTSRPRVERIWYACRVW